MQNKCRNTDAGFVSLEGSWDNCGWSCRNCGCWNCDGCQCDNCGCNRCSSCPCGRCGKDGRVYARSTRNKDCCKQDSGYAQSRSNDCDCGCSSTCTRTRSVKCCEDNTSIRSFSSCGCDNGCDKCSGSTYTRQNRSSDCGCDNGCDKCNASYTRQTRSSDCDCDNGCDKCNGTYTCQNRSNDCGCDKDNNSDYGRKNRGVGMVWAEEQELDRIFESESALRTGTLFPELHKPLNGYCPADDNCADECQEAAFAAWELRLYLNTHPDDKKALALFRKLCAETGDPNYATSFLNDECCTACWDWVNDPWPWECGANGN